MARPPRPCALALRVGMAFLFWLLKKLTTKLCLTQSLKARFILRTEANKESCKVDFLCLESPTRIYVSINDEGGLRDAADASLLEQPPRHVFA